MEINWLILLAVCVVAIALIIFLIRQNKKDKKIVEKEFNFIKKPDESETNDKDDGV